MILTLKKSRAAKAFAYVGPVVVFGGMIVKGVVTYQIPSKEGICFSSFPDDYVW